jgi:7,8-dihydropterin-6-yl-methyl-4-(beta-D-ribofuranosyl)aminobenzene 5'-phosphate synthase
MLVPLSPALALLLARKSKVFPDGVKRAAAENSSRIACAQALELPELKSLELSVVVEAKPAHGFRGDAAVSYLIKSERGTVLFDIGYGPSNNVFGHNWKKLGHSMEEVDAVVISHLHLDHMGGIKAQLRKQVAFPAELTPKRKITCYTPDRASSSVFDVEQVDDSLLLPTGLATTGPLARMLFFLDYTQEQSLIANLKGRGLVVFVGCGHPSLEVILSMVRKISTVPLYAIVGGLHFPITASRAPRAGLQVERIFGTGKKPNDPITDKDLDVTLDVLHKANPKRLLISAHDSCDHALERLGRETETEFEVLRAGQRYTFST